MKLVGKEQTIKRSDKEVYDFLADFRNFESLMPDQVTNWQADADSCSFVVQGMAEISLRYLDKTPYSYLKLIAGNDAPFEFCLMCFLNAIDKDNVKVHFEFDGKLNMMMEMMVKRPLQNLLDIMAQKLLEIFK